MWPSVRANISFHFFHSSNRWWNAVLRATIKKWSGVFYPVVVKAVSHMWRGWPWHGCCLTTALPRRVTGRNESFISVINDSYLYINVGHAVILTSLPLAVSYVSYTHRIGAMASVPNFGRKGWMGTVVEEAGESRNVVFAALLFAPFVCSVPQGEIEEHEKKEWWWTPFRFASSHSRKKDNQQQHFSNLRKHYFEFPQLPKL